MQKMDLKEILQLPTIQHLIVWLYNTIENIYVKGFDVYFINRSQPNSFKCGILEEIRSSKSASYGHLHILGYEALSTLDRS